MKLVTKWKLAGVMFWSLDLDDNSGEWCNQGRFPLTTIVKKYLQDNETQDDKKKWIVRHSNGTIIGCNELYTYAIQIF